ncbi:hypothetical protein CH373_07295 [Leptospira perolatii]|uniref:Uncharacterized protein n=1 Tax=Leptospira perolatii TaxID=2023191 RepID=A0A2M9ZPQ5_9LEPT|nr:hypothetical protein [Leptospira perolatii]PJZ70935.1 hypothetical protein CH360_04155 [Leptospira perolatii]PJZ74060.1 hypothetical protein CH373_07295 [Leptospira perolatii]
MRTPFYSILAILFMYASLLSAQGSEKEKVAAEEGEVHREGSALDKEYYEYYFKTLPNTELIAKAKLEYNIIRSLKLELRKRDPQKMTLEELKKVTPGTIRYERVYEDSIWMRGIRNQMQEIKFQDYMYIVVYEKYYCYISYEMNPAKYVQEPYQVQLIFQKENPFTTILPPP